MNNLIKVYASRKYVEENFVHKNDFENNGNIDLSNYETIENASAKLAEAKAYTDEKFSSIDIPEFDDSTVDNKISEHNTSNSAHNDIRELVSGLVTKLNKFLDIDDETSDQLSEVLTLINNNKGTLESITSGKVNVTDIIDNLTSEDNSKVLSAKQGAILKGLIDALQTEIDNITGSSQGTQIQFITWEDED